MPDREELVEARELLQAVMFNIDRLSLSLAGRLDQRIYDFLSRPAQPAQEGMVPVPREPSDALLRVGDKAFTESMMVGLKEFSKGGKPPVDPYIELRAAWRAMIAELAAAPPADKGPK